MDISELLPLSDRQARTVIIAAERHGFERDPDLNAVWYDHLLHEDAEQALGYLQTHDPDALRDALVAAEPIPADRAAERITESGRFSLHDADVVIDVAKRCDFTPPTMDLPLLPMNLEWEQARASVAFLWEHHPALLSEAIGELAQLAPLPEWGVEASAWWL